MELKKYKNDYGHERVKCPFCEKESYLDNNSPKRLHKHIGIEARKEAFQKALGDVNETPHLDYFIKHTKRKIVPEITKRDFDNDIKIK